MAQADFEDGKRDAYAFMTSPHYAWIARDLAGRDAIKWFRATPPQAALQFATPLPQEAQDWIRGFESERDRLLVDAA